MFTVKYLLKSFIVNNTIALFQIHKLFPYAHINTAKGLEGNKTRW